MYLPGGIPAIEYEPSLPAVPTFTGPEAFETVIFAPGTNAPDSIGKAASHGCIRMGRADLENLYGQVAVGDTVEIVGQRDEETAQLFGDPMPMPAVTAAVQVARNAPVKSAQATAAAQASATLLASAIAVVKGL